MGKRVFKLYRIWYPLSFLYGIGIGVRSLLFKFRLLPSEQYTIPVICVGNLSVGGTGKTPLIEYLIRLLSPDYRVAVLSRGYKRKSSGFVLAQEDSTAADIGDEPYQIKLKFPNVLIAVDKNRRKGMQKLLSLPDLVRPQVVLLDDGFQHQYIKPSLSIVVTDCNRLYYKDKLLPVGRLREPANGIKRADIIIVSKCKDSLKPITSQIIENKINKNYNKVIFFTSIIYKYLKEIFPEESSRRVIQIINNEEQILLVTGIANPSLFIEEVKKYTVNFKTLIFPDHHNFTKKDIFKMKTELQKFSSKHPLILCTEKDAARIRNLPFFPKEWKPYIYYIPLEVDFLFNKKDEFDRLILNHINNKLYAETN